MARNWNGIGTAFYGKRDFKPDGSYVTTEWLILIWIPVLPLKSLRVLYLGKGELGIFTISSTCYSVVASLPLDKKQILSIYAYMALVLGLYLIVVVSSSFGHIIQGIADSLLVGSLFLPMFLRNRARKNLVN